RGRCRRQKGCISNGPQARLFGFWLLPPQAALKTAASAATATLGAKGPVKLKNPWAEGPSILRTFPYKPGPPSGPIVSRETFLKNAARLYDALRFYQ
uniref:hypothetical protein n=1 Tax=Dialister succinatiphilus TaxID=487173 RepID=UPI0040387B6D